VEGAQGILCRGRLGHVKLNGFLRGGVECKGKAGRSKKAKESAAKRMGECADASGQ